jgi:hypothetical protein
VAYLWTYVLTYDMTYLEGGVDICDDICGRSYGITGHVMICISHDISKMICPAAMEIFFCIFSSFSLVAFSN